MKKNDLITPEGTRDLLFGESSAVKMVESRSMEIFRSKGYSQVITPGLEFYDVFALKSRYFPQETMYKLVDGKGRLMVVRPDSTLPIARMTAARLRGEAVLQPDRIPQPSRHEGQARRDPSDGHRAHRLLLRACRS